MYNLIERFIRLKDTQARREAADAPEEAIRELREEWRLVAPNLAVPRSDQRPAPLPLFNLQKPV